jgi:hypothetical protein
MRPIHKVIKEWRGVGATFADGGRIVAEQCVGKSHNVKHYWESAIVIRIVFDSATSSWSNTCVLGPLVVVAKHKANAGATWRIRRQTESESGVCLARSMERRSFSITIQICFYGLDRETGTSALQLDYWEEVVELRGLRDHRIERKSANENMGTPRRC